MTCRHCGAEVRLRFVDLGTAPPSNAYLHEHALAGPEKWYPLRVLTCERCWLVQTEDYAHHAELFSSEYAYFSSFSSTWLAHADRYVTDMVERFGLGSSSLVMEIASNDGYLLQFVKARGVPCIGVEPTLRTAQAARDKGIEVVEEFFGRSLASKLAAGGAAPDLMVANNVLAHVPDINDFVAGFARLLGRNGVATFEFPHLLKLVHGNQFDTIYHEHFSYLSLTAVAGVFGRNGLTIFDVSELATHGGSLRVFAQRSDTGGREAAPEVASVLGQERDAGVTTPEFYQGFQRKTERVKDDFLAFLLDSKRAGRRVAAYGAAAKGNTLMNFAGVKPDLIQFVVDRNPAKQGTFMPGSRIPIVDEQRLERERPDLVVVLPWNLRDEVIEQLQYVRSWGAKFVVAIPALEVID
ncbi:MAG TPA: class I SAM-dependent methyltransferase [Vicinamibacterales bacterium]|nr:class I SAM-dependent methyltransferase [Vicinamibacterales bacterium]